MKKYDYLIVGAGLFGAVFAHEATRRGKTCLVIDKRGHIGGNIYTEEAKSNLPDRQSEMWYDVSWVHPLSLSLLPADH